MKGSVQLAIAVLCAAASSACLAPANEGAALSEEGSDVATADVPRHNDTSTQPGDGQDTPFDVALCHEHCDRLLTCLNASCDGEALGDPKAFGAACHADCETNRDLQEEAARFAGSGCHELMGVLCATVPAVKEVCSCTGPPPDPVSQTTFCGGVELTDRTWIHADPQSPGRAILHRFEQDGRFRQWVRQTETTGAKVVEFCEQGERWWGFCDASQADAGTLMLDWCEDFTEPKFFVAEGPDAVVMHGDYVVVAAGDEPVPSWDACAAPPPCATP